MKITQTISEYDTYFITSDEYFNLIEYGYFNESRYEILFNMDYNNSDIIDPEIRKLHQMISKKYKRRARLKKLKNII